MSQVTTEASFITNARDNIVINPNVHSGDHALVGQVEHAFRRLIRNERDGGRGHILVPSARASRFHVCEMLEHESVEDASPVDGLERHDIVAIVVISSSRGEIEEMYAHVDNCQKMRLFS